MHARSHHSAWRALALAAALALGSSGMAVAAEPASEIAYINGGVGQNSEQHMKQEAAQWPLRMTFSKGPKNEFVADVHVRIADKSGNEVFVLPDAGPMTYVKLAPGEYRVRATHDGKTETRAVHVKGSTQENFHWGA